MTRNERRALTAQLARRLDERPDIPIMQRIFSILRRRPVTQVHPCYMTDDELYALLNPAPAPKEGV